ncbi:MAG: hypothetical protein IKK75_13720, partial [Clostridia bacterium]|nr:hypothetical protein [Clostridia bacterium]
MQNKGKQKTVEMVRKPIIKGSWHGKDARKMAFKRFVSVLVTTIIYLFGSLLLSIDALWGRILMAITLAGGAMYYQYVNGINQGENDAAYGEIVYGRRENGHKVADVDCDRSYHPMKGFFAVLAGTAPFVIFALVYACMAEPMYYTVGALPGWMDSLMNQTEVYTSLAYYEAAEPVSALGIMRVIDRAMIMPFVN